tara:strand:- start:423 stop:932 length:510 start_codon:yes stop_codon:yes gene_type:complete
MSNVIKANGTYVGTDQQGVIGKIYEELYSNSASNTVTRYLRVIKAGEAIVKGDLVGCVAAGVPNMHNLGTVAKIAANGVDRSLCAGIALTALATGEYGWAVCRGLVENVDGGPSIAVGDLLQSAGAVAAGSVDTIAAGSGTSNDIIGIGLTATDSSGGDLNLDMYIDVL